VPFLAKYEAEIIVSELEAKSLQGNPAEGVAVLRYPSEQAIQSWLNDPSYQPIKEIRMTLTKNANAVMAPAFKMPSRGGAA